MSTEINDKEMTPAEIREFNIFSVIAYQTMFVNDTAVFCFYDLLEALEARPDICRNKVKYRAGILHRHIKAYNAHNDQRLEHGNNFLADLFEAMSEEIRPDIQKLELTVQNYLHRFREEEVQLLTRVVLAETWAKIMVRNVVVNHEEFSGKIQRSYIEAVDRLRQDSISTAVLQLINVIKGIGNETDGDPVELSGNPDIYNGIQVILNKLSDADRIIRLCETHGAMESTRQQN